MDINGILSGEKPIQFEVSIDLVSTGYLVLSLLVVGIVLIFIGKKVIK